MTTASKKLAPATGYTQNLSFYQAALREALQESVFLPTSLSEAQDVKVKPGFETACWSFQPPHKIFVGDKLFEKKNIKPDLSEEQQARYIRIHYHHEQAHGLYTERDMTVVKKALESIKAPFQLFNLMEDAVIEHRYRQDNVFRFEWLEYETFVFHNRPESLLFAAIQAEGDFDRVEAALAKWEPPAPSDMQARFGSKDAETVHKELTALLPRVKFYYEKLIKLRSTMAVMPVLNAWLNEFGRPPPPPPGGGGMADMELSLELGTNPQAMQQFEQGAKGLSNSDSDPKKGGNDKVVAQPNLEAEAQSGEVLYPEADPVDMTRAQALATRLMPLFKQTVRHTSSLTPTKRISARHMAVGRSPYRKAGLVGKASKRILLEVDCSGSMGGFHMDEGKVLVSALSLLAQRGYVTGHVVLSIVKQGRPMWQTFKLPMAQEVIDRIAGYGGAEGLEYSLNANLKLAKEADYVFIYTDAQICDRPIDKAGLHRKGVFTWGLYAGSGEHVLDSMMVYFDKAIMRDNAEALVDAILAQT